MQRTYTIELSDDGMSKITYLRNLANKELAEYYAALVRGDKTVFPTWDYYINDLFG